jgi:hypothetical protein
MAFPGTLKQMHRVRRTRKQANVYVDARQHRWYIAIQQWRARREGGVRRAAQHSGSKLARGSCCIVQPRSFPQIMRKRKQE